MDGVEEFVGALVALDAEEDDVLGEGEVVDVADGLGEAFVEHCGGAAGLVVGGVEDEVADLVGVEEFEGGLDVLELLWRLFLLLLQFNLIALTSIINSTKR